MARSRGREPDAVPRLPAGLLQEELLAREDNQLRRSLKEAAFPFEKTMDDFDFRLRPELNRQLFLRTPTIVSSLRADHYA